MLTHDSIRNILSWMFFCFHFSIKGRRVVPHDQACANNVQCVWAGYVAEAGRLAQFDDQVQIFQKKWADCRTRSFGIESSLHHSSKHFMSIKKEHFITITYRTIKDDQVETNRINSIMSIKNQLKMDHFRLIYWDK